MGFDTLNGNSFVIPVSDTQSYRQFGNAVVVPVVRAVAQYMLEFLMDGVSPDQLRFDFGVLMSETAVHYG
jgi:DNA (cytosine-5)-methyltransferase 1